MVKAVAVKHSTTSGNVPPALEIGEFAINLVDKRIFTANATQVFDAFQNTTSDIAITNSSGGAIRIGNNSVNAVVNSTSLTFSNSTVTFTFPIPTAADVTAGRVISANGSWITPTGGGGGTPGGANTNIQFNDAGSFGGSSAFNFDKTSNTASLDGTFSVNADVISVGNTTVNTQINSTSISTGNASISATINSTAIMFGAKSIGAVNQSNGYSVMPNGLIFQWGYANANSSVGAVTFPTPFTTACFSMVVTGSNATISYHAAVTAVSTTGATILTTNATVKPVYYMAIGY